MNDIHDEGDSLLTPLPAAATPDLKQQILDQTTRVLCRRRLSRRVVRVAALAACYAAGVLTTQLWPSAKDNNAGSKINEVAKQDREPPAELRAPGKEDTPTEPAELPATALERSVALVDPEQRAELYRQAGDRYLEEDKDVESALRCYRRSLDENADADITISPDDNWLLMAVKNARMEEKRHALANE